MKPGTIFISHRSEYADIVRKLKAVIQDNSQGEITVFISEDIPRGDLWRTELEESLRESEHLFLIYGAPYEDWSWCFYEAGYFYAQPSLPDRARHIYCIKRKDIAAPSPLSHLQAVTDVDDLINDLIEIYKENKIQFDAAKLRQSVKAIGQLLFGRIAEFRGYPRICVSINNEDFVDTQDIPAKAVLEGDAQTIGELFGFAASSVQWGDLAKSAEGLEDSDKLFFEKWLKETAEVICAGRDNRIKSPQTVLVARRGGKRYRSLLYIMRRQGNDVSSYEFLAVDEVGGPTLGLPGSLLSLLTGVRMGFRFRYEIIEEFIDFDWTQSSAKERQGRARELQNIMNNVLAEYDVRSDPNVNEQNFYSAFGSSEKSRMRQLSGYWPAIYRELTGALAVFTDAKVSKEQLADSIERFRNALEALRLLNLEFLSRCCALVAKMMSLSDDEMKTNADALGRLVNGMKSVSEAAE